MPGHRRVDALGWPVATQPAGSVPVGSPQVPSGVISYVAPLEVAVSAATPLWQARSHAPALTRTTAANVSSVSPASSPNAAIGATIVIVPSTLKPEPSSPKPTVSNALSPMPYSNVGAPLLRSGEVIIAA